MEQFRGTTIVSVRRNGKVAIAGDGQVSMGNTVMKGNARKVRPLADGRVIAGFAGGTADAFTLFELFESKLEQYGNLTRAAIELAQEQGGETFLIWRNLRTRIPVKKDSELSWFPFSPFRSFRAMSPMTPRIDPNTHVSPCMLTNISCGLKNTVPTNIMNVILQPRSQKQCIFNMFYKLFPARTCVETL